MVRTQIQLTEEQARALKEVAARQQVSLAELVRRGVDRILADDEQAERYRRASALVGRYQDEAAGVAAPHDRYLEEVFR